MERSSTPKKTEVTGGPPSRPKFLLTRMRHRNHLEMDNPSTRRAPARRARVQRLSIGRDLCYAKNGTYLFPTVRAAHQRNLQYTLDDLAGWEAQMTSELQHRRYRSDAADVYCRIHDAGDYLNVAYLRAWLRVMRSAPHMTFYSYTKQVRMFEKWVKPDPPANFRWRYSYGGTQDDLINPDLHPHADVFPDEEALEQAGYTSQTPSDLRAAHGPVTLGITANNVAHLKNAKATAHSAHCSAQQTNRRAPSAETGAGRAKGVRRPDERTHGRLIEPVHSEPRWGSWHLVGNVGHRVPRAFRTCSYVGVCGRATQSSDGATALRGPAYNRLPQRQRRPKTGTAERIIDSAVSKVVGLFLLWPLAVGNGRRAAVGRVGLRAAAPSSSGPACRGAGRRAGGRAWFLPVAGSPLGQPETVRGVSTTARAPGGRCASSSRPTSGCAGGTSSGRASAKPGALLTGTPVSSRRTQNTRPKWPSGNSARTRYP